MIYALSGAVVLTHAPSTAIGAPGPAGTLSLPRLGRPSAPGKLPSLAVSFMTSRYEREVSFRNMKSSSAKDDNGGNSENQTLPNRNYLSIVASFPFLEDHRLTLLGFKNVDGDESRTIVMPTGARFRLPGEAIGLRYQYSFTETTTAELRTMRLEDGDFSDPSLVLGYNLLDPAGLSQRSTLAASLPMTEKSREENLITKASVRVFLGQNIDGWSVFINAFGAKSYFRGTPPEGGGRGARAQKPAGMTQRSEVPPPVLDEVDQALMEREIERLGLTLGVNLNPTPELRLTSSVGAARALTQKNRALWTTSARLLAATYSLGAYDVTGDVSIFSDAENFRGVSTPNIWGLGLRVTYTWGEKTRVF